MESTIETNALAPLAIDAAAAPPPDPGAEPAAFMVEADDGTRVHFLDWGEPARVAALPDVPAPAVPGGAPAAGSAAPAPGVLLVHGVAQTAWVWAPVARRLAHLAHVVAPDLRGHGLSDAPPGGYDLATLAGDALAAAEGAGLPAAPPAPADGPAGAAASTPTRVVVAGHGFGAAVSAVCAARLGPACAGLVLVDGGWDDTDRLAGTTLDEWLRSVEEPPEVMRSMREFLEDRASYDAGSWDADQERAARASVVELPSGRVVSSARRHAIERVGETLLAHDPVEALAALDVPIVALAARDDDGTRTAALIRCGAAVVAAGRAAPRYRRFAADGHNLMRYRPGAVAAAILALATPAAVPSRG